MNYNILNMKGKIILKKTLSFLLSLLIVTGCAVGNPFMKGVECVDVSATELITENYLNLPVELQGVTTTTYKETVEEIQTLFNKSMLAGKDFVSLDKETLVKEEGGLISFNPVNYDYVHFKDGSELRKTTTGQYLYKPYDKNIICYLPPEALPEELKELKWENLWNSNLNVNTKKQSTIRIIDFNAGTETIQNNVGSWAFVDYEFYAIGVYYGNESKFNIDLGGNTYYDNVTICGEELRGTIQGNVKQPLNITLQGTVDKENTNLLEIALISNFTHYTITSDISLYDMFDETLVSATVGQNTKSLSITRPEKQGLEIVSSEENEIYTADEWKMSDIERHKKNIASVLALITQDVHSCKTVNIGNYVLCRVAGQQTGGITEQEVYLLYAKGSDTDIYVIDETLLNELKPQNISIDLTAITSQEVEIAQLNGYKEIYDLTSGVHNTWYKDIFTIDKSIFVYLYNQEDSTVGVMNKAEEVHLINRGTGGTHIKMNPLGEEIDWYAIENTPTVIKYATETAQVLESLEGEQEIILEEGEVVAIKVGNSYINKLETEFPVYRITTYKAETKTKEVNYVSYDIMPTWATATNWCKHTTYLTSALYNELQEEYKEYKAIYRNNLTTYDITVINDVDLQEEVVIGDTTENGSVDIRDVTYLNQYLIKAVTLNAAQENNSDVIKDGKVNITDLGQLKKYIVKIVDSL